MTNPLRHKNLHKYEVDMTEQAPPKIEFPCPNYVIKTMGEAGDEFIEAVLKVMRTHAEGFDESRVKIRASSKGTFQSCSVYITATGEPQLRAIFEDLKKYPGTRMVL